MSTNIDLAEEIPMDKSSKNLSSTVEIVGYEDGSNETNSSEYDEENSYGRADDEFECDEIDENFENLQIREDTVAHSSDKSSKINQEKQNIKAMIYSTLGIRGYEGIYSSSLAKEFKKDWGTPLLTFLEKAGYSHLNELLDDFPDEFLCEEDPGVPNDLVIYPIFQEINANLEEVFTTEPKTYYRKDYYQAAPQNIELYFCELCQCRLSDAMQYNLHLKGKNHAKRERLDKTASRQYFCELCKVPSSTAEHFQLHLNGKMHAKKLRQTPMVQCERCNIWMTREDQMLHMCSGEGATINVVPRVATNQNLVVQIPEIPDSSANLTFSQKAGEKYPSLLAPNANFYCDVCLNFAPDLVQYRMHINGMKHNKKVKQNFPKCTRCNIMMLHEEWASHRCEITQIAQRPTLVSQTSEGTQVSSSIAVTRLNIVQSATNQVVGLEDENKKNLKMRTENVSARQFPPNQEPKPSSEKFTPSTVIFEGKTIQVSQKVIEWIPNAVPLDLNNFCSLCLCSASDPDRFHLHMIGKGHLKKLKQAIKLCDTCNIYMTMDEKICHPCKRVMSMENPSSHHPMEKLRPGKMPPILKKLASTGIIVMLTVDVFFVYSPLFAVEPLLEREVEEKEDSLNVGDWIEFNHKSAPNGDIEITDYNKIEPQLPTRSIYDTIQLKVDLRIPADYESYAYGWKVRADFIKEAYDLDDLINPESHCGRQVKAVVERGEWQGNKLSWKIKKIFDH